MSSCFRHNEGFIVAAPENDGNYFSEGCDFYSKMTRMCSVGEAVNICKASD